MKNCGRRSATVSSVGQGTLKKWTEISQISFVEITVVPRGCAIPSCVIFATTPFWIGFKNTQVKLFFSS